MSELVSVVMTCFNREDLIGEAIESVLSQTYADLELIIVDDRSTDRTFEVATSYTTDPRVRVLRNERNLGDYPNRSHAATFARGAFLKYHDSDDVMYPHCLSVMVSGLTRFESAAFALTTSRYWPGGRCPMLVTPRLAYEREFLGGGMFHLGPACALFRAEAFRALGGFPHAGAGSDALFWLRACRRVDVVLVSGDLFYYRTHPGQELQSERARLDYAAVLGHEWRALAAPDCPLSGRALEQARANVLAKLARLTWRDVRAGAWDVARARLKGLGLGPVECLRHLRRPRRDALAGTPAAGRS